MIKSDTKLVGRAMKILEMTVMQVGLFDSQFIGFAIFGMHLIEILREEQFDSQKGLFCMKRVV